MDFSFTISQPVGNTTVYQDTSGNVHVVVYDNAPDVNTGFTAELFDIGGNSIDEQDMTRVNTTNFWTCDLNGGTPRSPEPSGQNNKALNVTATKASGDPQGPNVVDFEYAVRP